MSTNEALELYPQFAKAVFGSPKSTWLRLPVQGSKSTHYSATILEKEIKKIVTNKLGSDGSENEPMIDSRGDSCKS
jgi:hypothetical protein